MASHPMMALFLSAKIRKAFICTKVYSKSKISSFEHIPVVSHLGKKLEYEHQVSRSVALSQSAKNQEGHHGYVQELPNIASKHTNC